MYLGMIFQQNYDVKSTTILDESLFGSEFQDLADLVTD